MKKRKPRGLRNNNPLNIRHSNDKWLGAATQQKDKAFVQFETLDYGYRAAWRILQTYFERFRKQGKCFTVRNIIRCWAPPEDRNHTEAYITQVMQLASLGGHENLLPPLNVYCYFRLSQLIAAMTCVENGISMSEVDTEAICRGYKKAFPRKAPELDALLKAEDEYWDWSDYIEEEDCIFNFQLFN